jgi:acyl-CoA-binding protein
MSDLKTLFEQASEDVKELPSRPDNATLLQLYAHFKQATQGDVQGDRPGFTDLAGRAKFDAWSNLRGMGEEEAMQAYVDLVEKLKA